MSNTSLSFWNHNSAYYDWIAKQLGTRQHILDVGCGDGTLLRYLDNQERKLIGIDPSVACINRARQWSNPYTQFHCCTFEDYHDVPPESFDAIIFVASLHHMDCEMAIQKAKHYLRADGILLVVGLATPSSLMDYLVEALRVIPCQISSHLHKMKTSEEMNIPTSYALPTMSQVRDMVDRQLPCATLRYGLYYRYLLTWVK